MNMLKNNKVNFFRIAAISAVMLIAVSENVFAGETLTWKECASQANEKNPEIVSAKEKVIQARIAEDIAFGAFLPQVNADLSLGRDISQGSSSYSYGLSGNLLLFNGLKNLNDYYAAGERLKAAEFGLSTTSGNIRLALRNAFVQLLQAQAQIKLSEKIATHRKQNLELVRMRYNSGAEHKGSLLLEEANLAQAEFEVQQAKRNIELSMKRLLKEMGRTDKAEISVQEDLNVVLLSAETPDFEKTAEENPALKSVLAQTEATRLSWKSAKADLWPKLSVNLHGNRNSTDFSPETENWSAGLSLSLPIYAGGEIQGEIDRAESAYKQAESDEQNTKNNIVVNMEETWAKLQDAVTYVEIQKKSLDAAEERSSIAAAQYSSGLVSFDNWTIIEDGLVGTQKAYLNAQINVMLAEANYLQAKGVTLDEEK